MTSPVRLSFALLVSLCLYSASAQNAMENPAAWIGATPEQVIGALGAPQALYAVRGPEPWQDDVVFVYDTIELYWFKDRVWQVRASSALGLHSGDTRETARAILGEPLRREEHAFVYQLASSAWPLRLQVRFAPNGSVSDLFFYRADF